MGGMSVSYSEAYSILSVYLNAIKLNPEFIIVYIHVVALSNVLCQVQHNADSTENN